MEEREEVEKAVNTLKSGGVILAPTDTIWGLSCDALNETAVKRLFEIKQRPVSKSLILLVSGDAMLNRYVQDVPEQAWDIMDMSLKPVTIVYSNPVNLPDFILADDGTIAIRVIRTGFLNKVIHKLGKPVTSTSPNISGTNTPTRLEDTENQIIDRCDYTAPEEAGDHLTGVPSSIIKVGTGGEIAIIRK